MAKKTKKIIRTDNQEQREELLVIMRKNYPKGKDDSQYEFVYSLPAERLEHYIQMMDPTRT
jgi:hypothetical protein